MVHRSVTALPAAVFIPLFYATVREYLKHAMEENAPKLKADNNHLERVQQFATRVSERAVSRAF